MPHTKILKIFILLILVCQVSYSQDIVRAEVDIEYEDIADELMKSGKYFEAISYYEEAKVEASRKSRTKITYKLADCYRQCRYYEEALALYQIVLEEAKADFPLLKLWLGVMQMQNENYSAARKTLIQFKGAYSGDKEYKVIADDAIKSCDFALANAKGDFIVGKMRDDINGEFSTNGAMATADTLWLTSTVANVKYGEKFSFEHAKGKYEEYYAARLFKSVKDGKNWKEREQIKVKLDNKFDNIVSPYHYPELNLVFYTICTENADGSVRCHLYNSKIEKGKLTDPEKVSGLVNGENYSSKAATVTKIGDKYYLFFTSDKKEGKGGFDLYYSEMDPSGLCKEPINIVDINTEKDEHSPFYDTILNTLFFSSKGYIGYGGFDIFKVKGVPEEEWESPENVGAPINSGADDYYYFHRPINEENFYGFVASNRKPKTTANTCCDKIYDFTYNIEIEKEEPVSIALKCEFYDQETNEILKNVTVNLFKTKNKELQKTENSRSSNQVNFNVLVDTSYYVEVIRKEYDTAKVFLNTVVDEDTIILEDIFLTKLKEKEPVVAEVREKPVELKKAMEFAIVYWGFGDYTLDKEEKRKLDDLAAAMKDNPEVNIFIASHTDNVDTRANNLRLSKRRSETVKTHLMNAGVDGSRLVAQWYGEEEPVATNQTQSGKDNPKGRKQNRRTEFGEVLDMATVRSGEMVTISKELNIKKGRQDEGALMDEETLREVLRKYGDVEHPDLYFRVQVGAFANAEANIKAKMKVYADLQADIESFIVRENEGKYTKFLIGREATLRSANEMKDVAKRKGIRQAFIVPYYKGERIKMVDAIEVLGQKP